MSRRGPGPDRTEQNRATLKSLVKLESNKSCADCKRNKHPRWASWNLGIFICIRCSGIHRGMGTHISRVKSVDLDSWTDEQLQSMLKWGNARANKYYEAKLAPGHVPSETKIENFIRTKYESKRWVMDGGMPDPSTLDADGEDDNVPLNVVKEKVQLERSASQKATSATASQPPRGLPRPQQQNIDLFGDDLSPAPARPSTTGPPLGRPPPPKAEAAPPKQTKPADSLLGLDFFGGSASAPPARPSSTGQAASNVPSRPDLKQSILSLYASAPKPPPQPQAQQQHGRTDSFGGLTSPGSQQQSPQGQQSAFGGLNDAFSSLSFAATPAPHQPKPSAFSGLDSYSSVKSPPSAASSAFGGGGSFFDTLPKSQPAPKSPPAQNSTFGSSGGFGDFSSFTSPATSAPAKPATNTSSGMGDLFDLSIEPTTTSAPPPKPSVQSQPISSAFNLSSPVPPSQPKPAPAAAPSSSNFSGFSNMDAWGSNDVWASNNTTTSSANTTTTSHAAPKSPSWGAPAAPQITQDDDFGGWSSATPAQTSTQSHGGQPKPLAGNDDLFSNVWE